MTNTEEQEIWKQYPKYPWIEASNLGRVRTKDRYVKCKDGSKRFYEGRILKQSINRNGYMQVHFRVNGKIVNLYVHRIVATCFIPNPNGYSEVNHKDNNPKNNRWDNLEWCTHEYNNAYREKYGTACNCPVIAVNPETSKVFWFESQHEAGRQLGVYQSNIYNVLKGKYNKTGSFWFCYADVKAVENTRAKFGDDIANKVKELMSNDLQSA